MSHVMSQGQLLGVCCEGGDEIVMGSWPGTAGRGREPGSWVLMPTEEALLFPTETTSVRSCPCRGSPWPTWQRLGPHINLSLGEEFSVRAPNG